jgi:hypothetical protein
LAKEKWKCPYPDCEQECSRHSNMVRHIERVHGGQGKPVKVKSSAVYQSIPNVCGRTTSPSVSHTKKPSDTTRREENDLVDAIYEDVMKANAKMNKIREIKAFFSEPSDSTTFLLPTTVPLPSIDPPVGFRMYVSADCLTGPIDPVRLSDFMAKGPAAFRSTHACKQEDLEIIRRRAEQKIYIDFITIWDRARLLSISFLANLVHQWYRPHNNAYIQIIEEKNSTYQIADLVPVNLGKIANNHWAYRASADKEGNGMTTIDDTELMDFLNLAKGTFAPFRVQIKNEEKYLYAYIIPKLMYSYI